MTGGRVRGTSTPAPTMTDTRDVVCPRCGISRRGRPDSTICIDCRTTDTWYAEKLYGIKPPRWTVSGGGRTPVVECKNGHPLTDGNVKLRKDGRRECLTCSRARDRAYQVKRKEAKRDSH